MNTIVKLVDVNKKFGNKEIIKHISLDVYDGEFLTLLGPSGCGKTTVLKIISGLESVTSGKVFIDGKDVTNVSASARPVNTIFQNFALFPHMSVWDNINYGLKINKIDKNDAKKRIEDAIKLVKLEGFEDRYPHELSGGQQQRVAIARGIVMKHKVLLLDESLCSLDLKLKREMQIELKKLQQTLGMTFIYVTHDQDEALTMSDRIAIINNGIIEQLDTPKNIYRKPKTTFIADFIGESNIISGTIKQGRGKTILKTDNLEIALPKNEYKNGDKVELVIRPEIIKLHRDKVKNGVPAKIIDYIYDGSTIKLVLKLDTKNRDNLKAILFYADEFNVNDDVFITFEDDKIILIGEK